MPSKMRERRQSTGRFKCNSPVRVKVAGGVPSKIATTMSGAR